MLTDAGYIEIENIKVGMRVLTHKGRWRRVTAVGCKKSNTVILRGNHYGLECTPNHPIYTTEECKDGNRISLSNEKLWLPAEKMKGRLWAVPRSVEKLEVDCAQTPKSPHYKPMPTMDEDFFYFVGRWLGDGWVRDAQRPDRPKGQRFSTIFLCDSCDKEHELCDIVGKLSEHYSIERGDTCVKVKFNGRILCDWLTDNFGRYAYGKKIPSWVYGLPKNYRGALLRGIFESDGYHVKGKREMWKVLTVSKKLAEGLRILGELEGYSTTVHYVDAPPTCEIEGRTVTQRPNYRVIM
ncbi:MAG: hypothetical protein LUH18_09230 [Oscillospiraceae bacterium]|nr:hypothetical protein [Oscillospiraceae bacterium]